MLLSPPNSCACVNKLGFHLLTQQRFAPSLLKRLSRVAGEHVGTWTDFPLSADDCNRVSAPCDLCISSFPSPLPLCIFPSISFLAFAEYLLCISVIRWQHASPHRAMHRNKVRCYNLYSPRAVLEPPCYTSAFLLCSCEFDLNCFLKLFLAAVCSAFPLKHPTPNLRLWCAVSCSLSPLTFSFKWQVAWALLEWSVGVPDIVRCSIFLLWKRIFALGIAMYMLRCPYVSLMGCCFTCAEPAMHPCPQTPNLYSELPDEGCVVRGGM